MDRPQSQKQSAITMSHFGNSQHYGSSAHYSMHHHHSMPAVQPYDGYSDSRYHRQHHNVADSRYRSTSSRWPERDEHYCRDYHPTRDSHVGFERAESSLKSSQHVLQEAHLKQVCLGNLNRLNEIKEAVSEYTHALEYHESILRRRLSFIGSTSSSREDKDASEAAAHRVQDSEAQVDEQQVKDTDAPEVEEQQVKDKEAPEAAEERGKDREAPEVVEYRMKDTPAEEAEESVYITEASSVEDDSSVISAARTMASLGAMVVVPKEESSSSEEEDKAKEKNNKFDFTHTKPTAITRRKRDPWTKTDDNELLSIIGKLGVPDGDKCTWSHVAEKMNGKRNGKQCRERYTSHLKPDVVKRNWSREEEKYIMRMYEEFGPRWARMATMMPHRTANDIKNKWYSMNRSQKRYHRKREAFNRLFAY